MTLFKIFVALEEWSSGVKMASNELLSVSPLISMRKEEVVKHLTRFKAEHNLQFHEFCAKVHVQAMGAPQNVFQARSTVFLSRSLMDETSNGGPGNGVDQEVDVDVEEGHMVEA